MLKGQKLARAKGYVLALGEAVYRRRETWAVLGFSGMGLQWLQRPGKSGVHNRAWISALGGGGGTPLQAALQAAAETLSNRAMRADAMDALVQVREGAP